ncbi:hypothetical protein ACFXO2_10365 [Streptomyces sp. NPDC059152]|uniref:hypothetical protein n=1 Tax=Streptomyces sp. NPDC059152 TaxID=3346742 RepID=UPI00369B81EC
MSHHRLAPAATFTSSRPSPERFRRALARLATVFGTTGVIGTFVGGGFAVRNARATMPANR